MRGATPVEVLACRGGVRERRPDWLAEERPVALVVNGISQAVMLATPLDLEDFALGFAFTEGWIATPEELRGVEVQESAAGIELQLEVSAASEWRLKERRRLLAGRTGCGLCGAESLQQVRLPLPKLTPQPLHQPLHPTALARAFAALQERQPLQRCTGAPHAAAWATPEGELRLVREDLGRHNALDKLIGALLRQGRSPREEGFACITSRASFEMVQKAARANIATVAAVSAPTQLAVQLAHDAGLLLLGFVRGTDWVAYTQLDRIAD